MSTAQKFSSLETETRSHVDTACAAFHLTRSCQTLRSWSCFQNGPIRPTRINRRLAWPVAEIKRLLNGGANA
ncbi:DNA-binding protein [Massilia sp. CCM 8692]|uniref:DNA-binding protein n=1 Tax=Massilia rubra TaxID=2607910 RepID=A0ABX0LKD7_9BURK|nr:DNA-binding protein [Massilia rubra]